MIVVSVIVLAIVGSAFTFKMKGGDYCVLLNRTSGTDCTTYLLNKTPSTSGAAYKYKPYWDGNKTACTAASNNLCTSTTPIQFQND